MSWGFVKRLGAPQASLRNVALSLVLFATLAALAWYVDRFHAIRAWQFWRYSGALLLALTWGLSCTVLGKKLLHVVVGTPLRLGDQLALAFPLGALCWGLAMFVLGLLGLLGWPLLVLMPGACLVWGGRMSLRSCRRWLVHVGQRQLPQSQVLLTTVATVATSYALALLYLPLLAPESMSYDARWYHLPIAEHYVAAGRVEPFREGWWLGAYPHLASYLYTWAFLLPKVTVFDRVMVAANMEFVCLLGTLAALPAFVRWLLRGRRVRFAWLGLFLFPKLFLYDSNLNVGADHIAALFAIPIALAAARFLPRFDWRWGVLLGTFVSAACLTKYTAVIIVVFPALAVALRSLTMPFVQRGFGWSWGLLACGGTVLALTGAHWLKNWIWYGSPMYPAMRDAFGVELWTPEATGAYEEFLRIMAGPRPGLDGVKDALLTTLTFAFKPNDYSLFHRDWPVFGFLFTATLPVLLLLRKTTRIWATHAAVMTGIFVWFLVNHYDRFLQAALPWMAGATVATLALIWRLRFWPARAALGALVAFQLVWGSDVPYFPTHNQLGDSPIRAALKRLASGFTREVGRFEVFQPWSQIGRDLPRNSTVLVHEMTFHLGLQARSVQDMGVGDLSYAELLQPAELHARYLDLGVTHVMWATGSSIGSHSWASDLIFFEYVSKLPAPKSYGSLSVAALPTEAPRARQHPLVLAHSCPGELRDGYYELSALKDYPVTPRAQPQRELARGEWDLPEIERSVGFLIVNGSCAGEVPGDVAALFSLVAKRGKNDIWIRN